MQANPYQAPHSVVDPASTADAARLALRQAHLNHERQIQSIGWLYLITAAMLVLLPVAMALFGPRSPPEGLQLRWVLAITTPIAAALCVLGFGFLRLQPWVRIPGAILSAIGLLAIPIGTLIHAWILYLMFCRAGRVVLAPEYQAVIDATPQVRYRRTLGDWIALGLVVALLALLVGALVMSRFG